MWLFVTNILYMYEQGPFLLHVLVNVYDKGKFTLTQEYGFFVTIFLDSL